MTMEQNKRNDLGKILKQRRGMIPLTLQELARGSVVSASHLGRIERGERFPSAQTLRRLAKPLGFEESELFTLANYLFPQAPVADEAIMKDNVVGLDSYVARVLSQEPVEVQQTVIGILIVMKGIARGMSGKC